MSEIIKKEIKKELINKCTTLYFEEEGIKVIYLFAKNINESIESILTISFQSGSSIIVKVPCNSQIHCLYGLTFDSYIIKYNYAQRLLGKKDKEILMNKIHIESSIPNYIEILGYYNLIS